MNGAWFHQNHVKNHFVRIGDRKLKLGPASPQYRNATGHILNSRLKTPSALHANEVIYCPLHVSPTRPPFKGGSAAPAGDTRPCFTAARTAAFQRRPAAGPPSAATARRRLRALPTPAAGSRGQGRGGGGRRQRPGAARRPARPRRACPERAPPAGESRGAPAPPPRALKGKGGSPSPGRWAAVPEGLPAKQTSGKRPAEPKEGFGRVGTAPGALSLLASWQFPSVQTHQEGVVGFKR